MTTGGEVNRDDVQHHKVAHPWMTTHRDQDLSLDNGTLTEWSAVERCTDCTRARDGGVNTRGPIVANSGEENHRAVETTDRGNVQGRPIGSDKLSYALGIIRCLIVGGTGGTEWNQ